VNEEMAMTVHARQLARLCRERLASQRELPVFKQQPEQQQAAKSHDASVSHDAAKENEQSVR
jgi:hypothetical protein